MSALYKKLCVERQHIRTKISKKCDRITELTSTTVSTEVQYRELETAHLLLTQAKEKLESLDCRINEEVPEEELVKELDRQEEYEEKLGMADTLYQMAHDRYQEIKRSEASQHETSLRSPVSERTVTPFQESQFVRLPTLDILPFDGKLTEWPIFWDQFNTIIHEHIRLTGAQKLCYLKSFLRGHAYKLIAQLTLTGPNYLVARGRLEKQYGSKDFLRELHIRNLMSLKPVKSESDYEGLRDLTDELRANHEALRRLEVDDSIVYPFVKTAIPERIYIDFGLANTGPSTVEKLIDHLARQVDLMRERRSGEFWERASNSKPREPRVETGAKSNQGGNKSSAIALNVQSNRSNDTCVFCKANNHQSYRCRAELSLQEKQAALRENRRCFKCFRTGHRIKDCKATIENCACGKPHFSVICPKRHRAKQPVVNATASSVTQQDSPKPSTSQVVSTNNTAVVQHVSGPGQDVKILQVVAAMVLSDEGEIPVTVLFDNGSTETLIREDVVVKGKLNIVGYEAMRMKVVGGDYKEGIFRRVSLNLRGLGSYNQPIKICGMEIPSITSINGAPSTAIAKYFEANNIPTTALITNQQNQIDILLGCEHVCQLLTWKSMKVAEALYAIETKLGWAAFGRIPIMITKSNCFEMLQVVLHLSTSDIPELSRFQDFWKLESIGIKTPEENEKFDEESFKQRIEYDDARYVVPLPWIPELKLKLVNNYEVARKRLRILLPQLYKKKLMPRYAEAIQKYEADDHAVLVPVDSQDQSYYMPHRAVFSEVRSTKTRIVFDASSHDEGQLSLNDCLFKGNDRTLDVVKHLFQFRVGNYAMSADIQKAFLQIRIKEEDQKFLKYLWVRDSLHRQIDTYQMTRVVFGLTCSPYLLKVVLQCHAEKVSQQCPKIKQILQQQTYVDDIFHTEDHRDELNNVEIQLKESLEWASMFVHKVTKSFQQPESNSADYVTILGLHWYYATDELEIKIPLEKLTSTSVLTKRELISKVSSIYDPLGYLSPITAMLKLLFQQTWMLGSKQQLSWDDVVPEEIQDKWHECLITIQKLTRIAFPRKLAELQSTAEYQLHTYCDASPSVYGAVIYLITKWESHVTSAFVFAKFRIAPVKTLSLPRLELMATLIGARIANYVTKNLPVTIHKNFFWTDSMIVLGWINAKKFIKVSFVNNRVSEIKKLTSVKQWFHCSGKSNPADTATKDKSWTNLNDNHIWWNGPTYESVQENLCLSMQTLTFDVEEAVGEDQLIKPNQPSICEIIEMKKFSSYNLLIRTTARVLEAIQRMRRQPVNFCKLLEDAENYWIVGEQLKFFDSKKVHLPGFQVVIDEKNRLRLKSRLGQSIFSDLVISPILLPAKSYFVYLLLMRIHIQNFHCGVNTIILLLRQRFWVPHVRSICKKIVSSCVVCRRYSTRRWGQPVTDLPSFRVAEALPFTHVGIDFAGPIFAKTVDGNEKIYVLVFSCATSRAIHLELTRAVSTDEILMAFKRFMARRGVPSIIYSDNARGFKRAAKTLTSATTEKISELLTEKRVRWEFIPDRAPWWGGVWERMVRTIKEPLRRVLGRACLTYEMLLTLVIEIEGIVNSRPLSMVSDSPDELQAITPAQLIAGRPLQRVDLSDEDPQVPLPPTAVSQVFKVRQRRFNHLVKRWKCQYLLQLATAMSRDSLPASKWQEGQVVIVTDDLIKKPFWTLARITKANVGRDGNVRSCVLRLPSGRAITRPIKLLIPLEE